jgi:hypothetical protein
VRVQRGEQSRAARAENQNIGFKPLQRDVPRA